MLGGMRWGPGQLCWGSGRGQPPVCLPVQDVYKIELDVNSQCSGAAAYALVDNVMVRWVPV